MPSAHEGIPDRGMVDLQADRVEEERVRIPRGQRRRLSGSVPASGGFGLIPYSAQVPLRKIGTAVPSGFTPSMDRSSAPTIKST